MRVLITGNRGFVGRHFERYYKAAATTCARLRHRRQRRLPALLRRVLPEGRLTTTSSIHCAAVVGGRVGIDGEPLHLMAEDLSIDAALFRWALHARPKRIVYFSSSAAYPTVTRPNRWRSPPGGE
jgi:nucleoside-diphosphate-sugar epimerase